MIAKEELKLPKKLMLTLLGIIVYYAVGMFVKIETANIHSDIMLRYPVLTMFAAVLGPIPGLVIGACGQICFDLTSFGYLKLPTVIGSMLLGLIIGWRRPDKPLRYTIDCLLANVIVWAAVVPLMDVWMRGFGWQEAFTAGLLHALINGLTCVTVGQIVIGSFKKTVFRKVVSVIVLIDALLLFTYGRRGFGNITVYTIAALLCIYSIFSDLIAAKSSSGWPFVLKMMICSALVLFVMSAGFLCLDGALVTATGMEDAVIILGAGLDGEEPNTILRERLDLACEYIQDKPDLLIIASGGQGEDEVIAEGEAMKRYLTKAGIDPDRIIVEDKSTTTEENFAFSRALAPDAERIVYITSDYHCFRAGIYAQIAGYQEPHQMGSPTRFWSLLPSLAREVPSVAKLIGRCFVLWLRSSF